MTIKALKIIRENEPTYVIAIAVSDNSQENKLTDIEYKRGLTLGGYVYDTQSKSYYVECCAYKVLGALPAAIYLTMNEAYGWKQRIPLSTAEINRYSNKTQRKTLKEFKLMYNKCRIQYLQVIDVY
jgi:hypothetical protein